MKKILLIAFAFLGASFGAVNAANIAVGVESVSGSSAAVAEKNKEEIPSRPRSVKRGYFGMVEVGEGVVMSTEGVYRTSLHVINGYRIFPWLSVGLSLGLKLFHGGVLLFWMIWLLMICIKVKLR